MRERVYEVLNEIDRRDELTPENLLKQASLDSSDPSINDHERKRRRVLRSLFYVRNVLIGEPLSEAREIIARYREDKRGTKNRSDVGSSKQGWATMGDGSRWRRPQRYD